jgi:hypothetical protein|tara:strand:- start:904 stop:1269 length:366 start_codon:yes stop_codon:yes gene_type:complete
MLIIVILSLFSSTLSYLKTSYNYKFSIEQPSKTRDLFDDDYKSNTGIDMRYPNISEANKESIRILENNLERLVLLNKLQNKNKTEIEKIQAIEDSQIMNINSSYVTTLHAGGLMDDFNNIF